MSKSLTSHTNRLIDEKSPYLIQHAANPVAWQPWDDSALIEARRENKPIFVSIGYSTCHWCHVMAHESFEDDVVAEKLNKDFICIKVDREERPDIDTAFMQACQMLNRHGGWPLNLFLTPEGKPFYALTYAPKHGHGRQLGFIAIVEKIAEIWHTNPENLIAGGEQLSQAIEQLEEHSNQTNLAESILRSAADSLSQSYDDIHAGFGSAPKFPQPHNAALLLRLALRFNDSSLQQMALKTLNQIEQGGISDQLGGGLHRYSVDDKWLVPHFEKMLYDQALITEAYLDAWQATGEQRYRNAAENILDYVLRELHHPEGGFYCGEDADSEGSEGTYYLWDKTQLDEILSPEESELFTAVYHVTSQGNFENSNILFRTTSFEQIATDRQTDLATFKQHLKEIEQKLLSVRFKRPHPHLDDKVLTGWNGLMIAAFARGSILLQRPDYLVAAQRATTFIQTTLVKEGRLQRRFRDGDVAIDAFHEDYAYFIHGLIELFFAHHDAHVLTLALELSRQCTQLFADSDGGYYDSSTVFIEGLGRGRSKQDGAIPAASSVTARNMIRLARLTGQDELEQQARRILSLHLAQADNYPTAFAYLLIALDLALSENFSLVVVHNDTQLSSQWTVVLNQYRSALPIIINNSDIHLENLLPAVKGKVAIKQLPTAWFCTGTSCLQPVQSAAQLDSLLKDHIPLKTFSK